MRRNARIYVMQDDAGRVKVGHSRRVRSRMKQIRASGLQLLSTTEVMVEAELIERTAHRLLTLAGKHVRGEWFAASHDEALAAIHEAISIIGGGSLDLSFPSE